MMFQRGWWRDARRAGVQSVSPPSSVAASQRARVHLLQDTVLAHCFDALLSTGIHII